MAVTGNWKPLASLVFASSLARCAASAPMISGLPPVQVTARRDKQPVASHRADAPADHELGVDPPNLNHAPLVATAQKGLGGGAEGAKVGQSGGLRVGAEK